MLELSHVSAFEFAEHQITVNTILPGAVITRGPQRQGAAQRWACDEADSVRLPGAARDRRCSSVFASDSARAITNQALAIDGGFSVS
jgi:NAD(P)-dependent dehydrogenase (short-subunit alcohol dehydrogenase family)